jgi:hypothetical protein
VGYPAAQEVVEARLGQGVVAAAMELHACRIAIAVLAVVIAVSALASPSPAAGRAVPVAQVVAQDREGAEVQVDRAVAEVREEVQVQAAPVGQGALPRAQEEALVRVVVQVVRAEPAVQVDQEGVAVLEEEEAVLAAAEVHAGRLQTWVKHALIQTEPVRTAQPGRAARSMDLILLVVYSLPLLAAHKPAIAVIAVIIRQSIAPPMAVAKTATTALVRRWGVDVHASQMCFLAHALLVYVTLMERRHSVSVNDYCSPCGY